MSAPPAACTAAAHPLMPSSALVRLRTRGAPLHCAIAKTPRAATAGRRGGTWNEGFMTELPEASPWDSPRSGRARHRGARGAPVPPGPWRPHLMEPPKALRTRVSKTRHRARPPPSPNGAMLRAGADRAARLASQLCTMGGRGGPMGAGAMSGFLGLPVRAAQSRLRANYEPPSICYEPLRADLSEFGTESLIIQHGELCTGHWALALGNYCIHPSLHARRHGRPACAANAPPTRRLRAAYVPPTCRLRAAHYLLRAATFRIRRLPVPNS